MKDLILAVKTEYFEQIASGTKTIDTDMLDRANRPGCVGLKTSVGECQSAEPLGEVTVVSFLQCHPDRSSDKERPVQLTKEEEKKHGHILSDTF